MFDSRIARIFTKSICKPIRREMKTVEAMIRITCAGLHSSAGLCQECFHLRGYAMTRLEHCRFGAEKPTCAKCPVHCYKPDMRERIRAVMRYAGPRMVHQHPWLSLVHLWKGALKAPSK